MVEIAPGSLLPLATLLSFALGAVTCAAIVLGVRRRRGVAGRLAAVAAAAGLGLAAGSAVLRSSRGAGTGTYTAFGWPRAVYTRWVSWETAERRQGLRPAGLAENAIFYGALAALAGSLWFAAQARRRTRTSPLDPNPEEPE
jgi:hypothetical protein